MKSRVSDISVTSVVSSLALTSVFLTDISSPPLSVRRSPVYIPSDIYTHTQVTHTNPPVTAGHMWVTHTRPVCERD